VLNVGGDLEVVVVFAGLQALETIQRRLLLDRFRADILGESSPQTPTDEADNFHNHEEKQHRGEVGNPIRLFRFHFKASCQAS
jgi:hypothetical protein